MYQITQPRREFHGSAESAWDRRSTSRTALGLWKSPKRLREISQLMHERTPYPPSATVTICKEPFGKLPADIPSLSEPIISGTLKPMHTCIWGNFRRLGFISVFRP